MCCPGCEGRLYVNSSGCACHVEGKEGCHLDARNLPPDPTVCMKSVKKHTLGKLNDLYFYPFDVVSRYHDPQLT